MSPKAPKQMREVSPDKFKKTFSTWVDRINPGYTSSIRVDEKSVVHVYNIGEGVDIHCIKGREHYTYTSPEDCASYIFSILSPEKRGEFYRKLKSQSKPPYPLQTDFHTEPVVVKGDSTEGDLSYLGSLKDATDANISRIKELADIFGVKYNEDIESNPDAYNKLFKEIEKKSSFIEGVAQHKVPDPKEIDEKLSKVKEALKILEETAKILGIKYELEIDSSPEQFQKVLSEVSKSVEQIKDFYNRINEDLPRLDTAKTIMMDAGSDITSMLVSTYYDALEFFGKITGEASIGPILETLKPAKDAQVLLQETTKLTGDEYKSAMKRIEEYQNQIRSNVSAILPGLVKVSQKIRDYFGKSRILPKLNQNILELKSLSTELLNYRGVLSGLGIGMEDNEEKTIFDYLLSTDDLISRLKKANKLLGDIEEKLYKENKSQK